MAHLGVKYPGTALFAAGWSLGANILVRYLGEEGAATPIAAAAAMCNPFNLVRRQGKGREMGGKAESCEGGGGVCEGVLAVSEGRQGGPHACLRIPRFEPD